MKQLKKTLLFANDRDPMRAILELVGVYSHFAMFFFFEKFKYIL